MSKEDDSPLVVSEVLGFDRLLHRKVTLKTIVTQTEMLAASPRNPRTFSPSGGGPSPRTKTVERFSEVIVRALRWTDKLEAVVQSVESGEVYPVVLGYSRHGSRHVSLVFPVSDLSLLGEEGE